jgi:hypothetical protein
LAFALVFIAIIYVAISVIDPLNRNKIETSDISWKNGVISKVVVKSNEIDQIAFEKKFSIEKLSDEFNVEINKIDLNQNSFNYNGILLGLKLKAKGNILSKVKENNLEYKFDGNLGYYNFELDEFRFKPVSAILTIINQKQDNKLIFKSSISLKKGNLNAIKDNIRHMFPAFLFFQEQMILKAIE